MAYQFVQRDLVARIAPNIVKHATVTLVSLSDMLRDCNECRGFSMDTIDYADFKIDFGNNEVCFKCKAHLIECDQRIAHMNKVRAA